MISHDDKNPGPDLSAGISIADIPASGMVAGHVGGTAALLIRRGGEFFAIGSSCTHYGGPLAEGLVEGHTIRCPWHHACFDLRSGAALRAPALDPVPCWRVEVENGMAFAREPNLPQRPHRRGPGMPSSVLIIGGGAAGNAAAETLRLEGYTGPVVMISADPDLPCDRPNLSKDYLAGKAPEEWTRLRPARFYDEQEIELRLDTTVAAIDPAARSVRLADGSDLGYGALLLATGAEPARLDIPGSNGPTVHYLRSLADCRALLARAGQASSAAVLGAGFIGLEAAAALRAHGLDVHVIAPDAIPMERLLGPELGAHIRLVHERNGIAFHLGRVAAAIAEDEVVLDDGSRIAADLVLVGIGVRPRTALAETAGIAVERGVLVDQFLETISPGIFAAGDIARWPDPHSDEQIRVEHFVVAERQGQVAARNMLGLRQPFDAVPFFWTEQHGLAIAYVGHAEKWDEIKVDGSIAEEDCRISYRRGGRELAVAVINRDLDGLRAEVDQERKRSSSCSIAPMPGSYGG